jgi:iron complex transport system substrate-binding protein
MKPFTLLFILYLYGFLVFSQNHTRVVSLAPSLTENIYLLGAENKLVGCTNFCTQAVADGIQIVGSAIDVNVEKVFALQPDLVITMELTKPQDIASMKKLGINVVIIPTPKTFEEICEQTIQIGDLTGSQKEATAVINQTKEIVNEIKTRCAGFSKKQKIFFQIGSNPIFTVLENTFMDDFILLTNSENIAKGLNKGTMTRESILLKNPDIIIIATMGGGGEEEKKVWESYGELAAVKNKKVFLIDSETACSPTPSNFASAIKDVYRFVSQSL